MSTKMVSCAERLIKECEELASNNHSGGVEVDFSKHFQELTAEVISRAAFGSSYKEGKEFFHTQRQLLELAVATLLKLQLPGFKQVVLLLFFFVQQYCIIFAFYFYICSWFFNESLSFSQVSPY